MNTAKTFFLMMALTGILLLVGAIFGGIPGVVIALVFALLMNFGAYWFSDRIALGMTHSHPITENEDPELYSIVREQASLAELPMPKVYENRVRLAQRFRHRPESATRAVAVTTGIRRILTRRNWVQCWPMRWPTLVTGTP